MGSVCQLPGRAADEAIHAGIVTEGPDSIATASIATVCASLQVYRTAAGKRGHAFRRGIRTQDTQRARAVSSPSQAGGGTGLARRAGASGVQRPSADFPGILASECWAQLPTCRPRDRPCARDGTRPHSLCGRLPAWLVRGVVDAPRAAALLHPRYVYIDMSPTRCLSPASWPFHCLSSVR